MWAVDLLVSKMDYTLIVNSIIANLPATLVGLATLVTAYRASTKLDVVHKQINSRMDQLLNITASSSKAEGIKEEKERT